MTHISLPAPLLDETKPDDIGLLSVVIPPLDGEFLYTYKRSHHPMLAVGDVITVSLGRRTTNAFIISIDSPQELSAQTTMESRGVAVKQINVDATVAHAFNEEHLVFFRWVAKYYAEPLSKIIDLAVPTPSLGKTIYVYRPTSAALHHSLKLTATQRAAIDVALSTSHPISAADIFAACGASPAVINGLLKKGLLERSVSHESYEAPQPTRDLTSTAPALNQEQQAAIAAVRPHLQPSSFAAFLLHGVTGSGKTEVYLELIQDALAHNTSALVIVPEIALTPQLTDRFTARLQQPVAVLHSSLRPRERWQHWSDLATGRVRVAIGARSAIFAPMKTLGIVVVDEEHDSSFKQGEGIRYHGRDLAIVRAKLCSCPVVLGSATPSLESYHHATHGKYHYLSLSRRFYDAPPSTFQIIDLNTIKPWEMASRSISPQLLKGLTTTLAQGGQSFILFNKRGFATYLQCSSCEYVVGCPHCSVTLTYHRNNHSLLCHQCNYSTPPPVVCSGCGAQEPLDKEAEPLFAQRGSGTERVHEEIASLIPSARIAKLDRDSASSIADYIEILGKVRAREIDILVGTQMIAKGHDLPNVTFVGIVDCDVGLHVPDFRASERVFHLLTQVAGRAGRRLAAGHIVLQTRVPNHPSLTKTTAGDYVGFATHELQLREEIGYPPFQKLLRIVVSGADRAITLSHATAVSQRASSYGTPYSMPVLGPAPAPIERVRNMWRYHILLKSTSTALLQHVMQKLKTDYASLRTVRIAFDLDPHDML